MKPLHIVLLSLLSTIATATTLVVNPGILKPLAKPLASIGIPITNIPFLGDLVLAADLPKLSAAELKVQLDEKADQILLIDVRTDEEFKAGHLPGAVHIPLQTIESGEALASIREKLGDKQLVAYCHSGRRSALAIGHLQTAGIPAIQLTGGIVEWKKQVDPNIVIR
jgi:rhodanese-related sulfurtransferase